MTENLQTILESVADEQSFLQFMQALAEDWEDERESERAKPSSPTAQASTDGRTVRSVPIWMRP